MNSIKLYLSITIILLPQIVWSMGLRSFVALPIEQGGHVVRLISERNNDQSTNYLKANYAYGISAKQTLLLGIPYRLSPSGANKTGNISALYRQLIWQNDKKGSTHRIGLLGGAIIPTKSERDGAIQLGAVSTFYQNRYEVDANILFRQGLGKTKNSGRYDLSWQYRLSPDKYPEWGLSSEWDVVLELNGRFIQGQNITHQVTTGLQWIHKQWVLEGGVYKDVNNNYDTGFLVSTRFHF